MGVLGLGCCWQEQAPRLSKIQITSGLADGTEAGLGVSYFTENFIQGSSPLARQRGGGADYFDCCEKLVQTDPRAPLV